MISVGLARMCCAILLVFAAEGRQVISELPTKSQSRLVTDIQQSGGHFDAEAGADPLRIQTVYLPKNSLNQIRPTSLAVFPNLKALMIIETRGNKEHALTGCLVDDINDLLALEYAYRDANWIK